MEQYIKKSDIVAVLESLRRTTFTNFDDGVNATVQTLLEMLDTLEVKEVDLEKEANEAWDYIFSHGWDENSRMVLKNLKRNMYKQE